MKLNVMKLVNGAIKSAKNHAPEILTGVGVAGMFSAIALAVASTPKALRLLEKSKRKTNRDFTAADTVKTVWKCYIPTAAVSITSAACLIGASASNYKRRAVLAGICSLSERTFADYRKNVAEALGEKKEQEIASKSNERAVKRNPPPQNLVIGDGEVLCYDYISKQYFRSNAYAIQNAEIYLNRKLNSEWSVSLNEFYYELSPMIEPLEYGDDLGWNADKGQVHIRLDTFLGKNDIPCLTYTFDVPPFHDYHRIR